MPLFVLFCRWFDKSFTLISTINGFAGINFEHSWGDGVAVLRYFQDIFKDFVAKPRVNENTQIITLDPHNTPQKLSNFITFLTSFQEIVPYSKISHYNM